MTTLMRVHALTETQALAFITEGEDDTEVKARLRTPRRATCSVHGNGPHDLCDHTRALAHHHHERTTP